MKQAQLDHEVARATGESRATIARMGFSPLTASLWDIERPPLVVDWDTLDSQRGGYVPQRSRERPSAA